MKKALVIIRSLHTILNVVATVALILTVCVQDNDDTTIKLVLMFLTTLIICLICALVEDLLKNQIDRHIASLERELQKRNERMFCDVHPCRSGWERRAN